MPYVDLFTGDDSASLWYSTNAPDGMVSGFDSSRPTIIMLHPFALDSTWVVNYLDDPRIGLKYNIIAFDSRFSGKSQTKLSGKIDYWVQAADLAYACQILHLPPAHFCAEETESICVALRFSVLFPEMCLSLALITVPPPNEPHFNVTTAEEILRMWGFAESLEDYEHAISEMLSITVGQVLPLSISSFHHFQIVSFWQTTYPPFRRTRFMGLYNLLIHRTPLSPGMLARITQPVLLIHGEKNENRPLKHAEDLKEMLTNAQGVRLAVVRGCAGYLSLLPTSCSILVQFYTKFLGGLSPARSELRSPSIAIPDRMAVALRELAELSGREDIASRSARSCMSFSLVPVEVERKQMDILRSFHHGEREGLSPLDALGRPLRRYTDRYTDHWFSIDVGSDSIAFGVSTHIRVMAAFFTSTQVQRAPAL
ncbi:alpha/beta-hydrolase [Vararia minispora EC-137]|uniref:Alpha/beta-hydrolase n=1 Tax=Vararia minispora EC-137 TaxID=1314806 RepID=A0ACB8QUY3_9AGAM|nr:alpha/beta-hydrolase [Vararia minispora EC-137]